MKILSALCSYRHRYSVRSKIVGSVMSGGRWDREVVGGVGDWEVGGRTCGLGLSGTSHGWNITLISTVK